MFLTGQLLTKKDAIYAGVVEGMTDAFNTNRPVLNVVPGGNLGWSSRRALVFGWSRQLALAVVPYRRS